MISKVKLAGVALTTRLGERQSWVLSSGGRSPRVQIVVSPEMDVELGGKEAGPISLEMRGVYWKNSQSVQVEREFTHLFLADREAIVGDDRVVWSIFDIRAFLENIKVFATFNATRPVNDLKRFGKLNQKYFNQISKTAYLTHTLMKGDARNPQMGSMRDGRQAVRPWTAYNLVFWLLRGWWAANNSRIDVPGVGGLPVLRVAADVTDNGFVLDNFSTNRSWSDVFDYALAKAGLQAFPDNGVWVIKREIPIDLESNIGGFRGAGVVTRQNTSRTSFRALRVITPKRNAVRYDFLDVVGQGGSTLKSVTGEENVKQDISRILRNVLSLPQDIHSSAEGRTYLRGTYVTVDKALQLWSQDTGESPARFYVQGLTVVFSGEQQLTKETVYPLVYRGQLKEAWTYGFYAKNDAKNALIWAARADAVSSAIRRVFQLPLSHIDAIKSIELADVELVDPLSGTRAPVQVYCDRFSSVSQSWQYPLTLSHPAATRPGVNEFAWSGTLEKELDFKKLRLTDGNLADTAKLTWVNKAFGIFKLSFDRDISGQFQDQLPFLVEPQDIPPAHRGPAKRKLKGRRNDNIRAARTLDYWRMSVILSIVWKTPNSIQQYHVQEFDKSNGVPAGHFGPNIDIESNNITADYRWVDGKSELKETPNGVIMSGGDLINGPILESFGQAVLRRAIFQASDREIGNFKEPGVSDISEPRGHVRKVEIFHQAGEIATIHYASTAPVPPQFKTQLSKEARRVIFRDGADD